MAIMLDDTRSVVLNEDSQYYQNDFPGEIFNLQNDLEGEEYNPHLFGFSDGLIDDVEDFHFDRQGTNIAKALEEVYDRFFGRNLGAVVLASDGIYNQGRNPLHQARQMDAPIYTIKMGDTTPAKDILIEEVLHNRVVYSGNEFQVRVRVEGSAAEGETTTLNVKQEDSLIREEEINIDDEEFFTDIDFFIEAGDPGLTNYHFELEGLEGEVNYENNTHHSILEVLESEQKILFTGSGVHPDIGAIRGALERQDRFEVDYVPIDELAESGREADLGEYRMMFLHGVPSGNEAENQFLEEIQELRTPLFFVLTSNTELNSLNDFAPGFEAEGFDAGKAELFGEYSGAFSYFHFPPEAEELVNILPPAEAPVREFSFADEHEILLESRERRRGMRSETPLMFFVNRAEQPVGVFNGEGMWRWFTHNYREEGSHAILDDVWFQTAQFLAAERDRERFRVYMQDRIFQTNEEISITAEKYNEAFQPVDDAEIFLEVTDEDGSVFNYNFHPEEDHYKAHLGRLEEGSYSYRAHTEYGGDSFEESGEFAVEPLDIEGLDLQARHSLLDEISDITGGRSFHPNEVEEVTSAIRQNEDIVSVTHRDYEFQPLISQPWLFGAIILLISGEWFMRKFYGSY